MTRGKLFAFSFPFLICLLAWGNCDYGNAGRGIRIRNANSRREVKQEEQGSGGTVISCDGVTCSPQNGDRNCTQAQPLVQKGEGDDEGLKAAVEYGLNMSLRECQHRFQWSRWNCSDSQLGTNYGTKENAYITSVTAAAVTFAIAKACARGDIPHCGCIPPTTVSSEANAGSATENASVPAVRSYDHLRWGGCSADMDFALRLARRFHGGKKSLVRTSLENEVDPTDLNAISGHNAKMGRSLVRTSLDTDCKCHGVSGSCSLKTCWTKLPKFGKIGHILYTKYKKAKKVRTIMEPYGRKGNKTRLSLQVVKDITTPTKNGDNDIPLRTDLVFLRPSPTYCEEDVLLSHLGTKGRRCLRQKEEEGSCDVLCCGRGYNTHIVWRRWKCNCTFQWCCDVKCEECKERRLMYTCN